MRAAAQKLYALDAASFTTPVKLSGAWALPPGGKLLSQISGYQDFGWGVEEGDPLGDIDFANQNGILIYHYIYPMNWFRQFPDYTVQPPYDTIIAALNSDAASGTRTTVDGTPTKEMAQAVINSSPYRPARASTVVGSYVLLVQRRPAVLLRDSGPGRSGAEHVERAPRSTAWTAASTCGRARADTSTGSSWTT